MIAFVRGRVAAVGITSAVVEVGGVGLDLQCAPNTIAELRVGAEALLPTSMVVREDSMTLYGFATEDEKQMFELVQTASGVGPKVAQAMLAVLSPDTIRQAIGSEDARTLTQVPGIGQKGAQRIILELKDRVGSVATLPVSTTGTAAGAWQGQVHSALVGLGWSAREADKAVTAVAADAEAMDVPEIGVLLRAALRTLSKS
jgi:Holliday junction DNA helicase RuvA